MCVQQRGIALSCVAFLGVRRKEVSKGGKGGNSAAWKHGTLVGILNRTNVDGSD